jgi:hypothetical protein
MLDWGRIRAPVVRKAADEEIQTPFRNKAQQAKRKPALTRYLAGLSISLMLAL